MIDYADVQVLLVEDTVEDAELMLRTLRKSGLANDLHHVQDGAEALQFLLGAGRPKTAMPRLVLLDLKLPKVNGLEVLRRLRAEETTRSVPVVMITSSREDRDIEQAYRLGANGYVVKPLDFVQFAETMREVGMYWLLINEVPTRPSS